MDFSKMIKASEEADFEYARWYSKLPDERKAEAFLNGYNLVVGKVRHDMKKENPFATESDIRFRYIELTQKEAYSEESFDFIEKGIKELSEKEWKERFKHMKDTLGWSYEDIATYIGSSSGNSVKASINRKIPAFAKLAICIFEQCHKNQNKPTEERK